LKIKHHVENLGALS